MSPSATRWTRDVGHQVYYSLIGREYKWELMPLGLDQGVGRRWCGVPLDRGLFMGKIRRGQALPKGSRLHKTGQRSRWRTNTYSKLWMRWMKSPKKPRTLNWLLQRPTVSTVIMGARNEEQLKQNLASAWMEFDHRRSSSEARCRKRCDPGYRYWHQHQFCREKPAAHSGEVAGCGAGALPADFDFAFSLTVVQLKGNIRAAGRGCPLHIVTLPSRLQLSLA